jgi:putative ABC transport system substrate-binding protein
MLNSRPFQTRSGLVAIGSEMVPQVSEVGVLLNRDFAQSGKQLSDLQEAARAVGVRITDMPVSKYHDIEAAFTLVTQQRIAVLIVAAAPFFDTRRTPHEIGPRKYR